MAELEIKPTSGMITRVAGLFLAATALLVVIVWLLTGGGANLFAPKVEMKTYMPDATGLAIGAEVRLSGIQVGVVNNVAISRFLDAQRAVRVDLQVKTAYLPDIPADSQTSIGSDTLVGDKFLDIAAGKSAAQAGQGSELPSEPLESAADKADLIYGMQDSMKKLDNMLQELSSPKTAIGHYIVGDQEYNHALRSVDGFERSLRGFAATGTSGTDVLFSPGMYAGWDKSLKQIDNSMQALQRGEGTLGHLYVNDDRYNTILAQIVNVRKSLVQAHADMEKAGPGLRDDATYRKITALLAKTDKTISALNRGEGSTGELLTSPQLYESLVGSLKSLQEMLKDFDANPQKYTRTKLF